MARSRFVRRFACLTLILLVFALGVRPSAIHGQGGQNCNIDLSEATALMTQAQAKVSSGDQAAALALLKQVQQKLEQIAQQCSANAENPADIKLTQKYTDTGGNYTLNYPDGWITSSLPGPQNEIKTILFASDQATVNALANNKATSVLKGVAVAVGTRQQVLTQLGAYDKTKTYDQMDVKTLVGTITAGIPPSSGGTFGAIESVKVNDREAAEASLVFTATNGAGGSYDGVLLVVKLSNDKIAALVGVITPGQEKSIEPLTRAMAATIQLSQ